MYKDKVRSMLNLFVSYKTSVVLFRKMADVEQSPIRQETMTSLVMDSHKSYQENCKSSSYPEVQLRTKSPADSSETQRKKRARNRLSNRRSTGFVFEDQVEAALKMGPETENNGTSN